MQEDVFITLLFCVFVELPESHEQCFPPAAHDGDPAHEQRVPGYPSTKSAGVSARNEQRWVS